MIKLKPVLLIAGLGFLLLSCATKPDAYLSIDSAVFGGSFTEGIEAINAGQDAQKPLYPQSNAIALHLDRGMLNHYAGNYAESSRDLQEAERLIEEAYTKSVSAEAASYIANDNSKDYAGEDFEDIYINVFNSLNYYKQGNVDGALVEIRKLILSSGKLDMLSRKYEEGGRSAGDYVMEQLGKIGFTLDASLPQGQAAAYSGSALAQYLGGLFFLADGNEDSARIAFNAVGEAYAANPGIYNHPVPRAVEEARNVPEGMARLNVIAFAGLSPVKEEGEFTQNWAFMQNAELRNPVFKLPVFVDRDSGDHRVSVSVNGETFDLELIEDMGTVARETYNAKFANLFFKTYMRVLLKYAAADIAATAAGQTKGGNIARLAAANAARVAVNASESADIRMGRYLPNRAYVGGINLEPGSYPVTISFSSGAVKELVAEVKANDINLVDAVSLTALPGERRSYTPTVAAAGAPAAMPSQGTQGTPAAAGGAPAPSDAKTLDAVIEEAARGVESTLPQGTKLAVLNFASGSEMFSDYVIEEFTGALVSGRKLSVVARQNLPGELSDEQAREAGRQLGAESVVSGSLSDMGTYYRFRIRVIDVGTAAIQEQASYNLINDAQVAFLLGKPLPVAAAPAPQQQSAPAPQQQPTQAAPASQQTTPAAQQSAAAQDPDAWKRKWLYLGGAFGGGFGWSGSSYTYWNGFSYVTSSQSDNQSLFYGKIVFDFALLPFFSIELDLGFRLNGANSWGRHSGGEPLIPILGKLGGRIGKVELSLNAGYTVFFGFTFGATFGFKAGPGILFTEYIHIIGDGEDIYTWYLGYKGGVGNKKKRGTGQ